MLPKMFPSPDEVVREEVAEDENLSDTRGAWEFTDDISPEDAERVMATMLSEGAVLSGEDLEDGGGWI